MKKTNLESSRVVQRNIQQSRMIVPIHPSLRVRLSSFDRSDVRRLSVVVPSQGLDQIELVPVGDESFPSRSVEPIVRSVDPVLVPAVDSVVGEEDGGDGGLKGKKGESARVDSTRLSARSNRGRGRGETYHVSLRSKSVHVGGIGREVELIENKREGESRAKVSFVSSSRLFCPRLVPNSTHITSSSRPPRVPVQLPIHRRRGSER